jgi:hypothetical protein
LSTIVNNVNKKLKKPADRNPQGASGKPLGMKLYILI